MAQLRDTVVSGSLRATDSLLSVTAQFKILEAPTASNGDTYGPGTNGHILISNGTSAYWGTTTAITQVGTITSGTWQGTTIDTAYGGTGNDTGFTQWGIIYANPATKLISTSAGSSGYLLQGNGSAAPDWIQATNANIVNTIVKRDGSGNFSADTITAALNGNADTATALTSNAGDGEQPIYFTGGKPSATSYALKATVNNGDTNYVACYSGERTISSSKASTSMLMPAHYYHNLYNNNPTTGTTVYVHYYNNATTSTNTFANLRVKAGSSYKVLAFGGDGTFTWDGTSVVTNSGTWGISITGNATTASDCSGNAATATRINGNLGAISSATNCNIWVSSNASASGIPKYISGVYVTASTGVITAKGFAGPLTGNVTGNCSGTAGGVAWANVSSKPAQATRWPTWAEVTSKPAATGGATTPVYWNGSGFTNCTAYGSASVNYATSSGSCSGNAETATKATQDGSGNTITSTYLKLSGGTMTGMLYTSFKSGAAMCAYGSSQTTVANLLGELRYSNGATGSASLTAYTTTAGGNLAAGWYNFFYSPHRVGGSNGAANSDNCNYGCCILGGMTVGSNLYYIRYSSSAIAESRRIWMAGNAVTNAVWNDLAECRKSEVHTPGYAITQAGKYTTKRLEPGCRITSDTWGFALGNEEDKDKMPVAISGRVLAYPYRPREEYHLGDCVCSAPDGKVDIMTRQEIRDWPDCIIGIVNEIPDYEEWGSEEKDNTDRDKIKVNGRIWIDIK